MIIFIVAPMCLKISYLTQEKAATMCLKYHTLVR